ncbi:MULTISPECIES: hypothetical protein [unclassified Ensifer]|uniref:hypothetical protein n=1 Tax=unclassified Ensifer TaxID=2633371 RepID=UPI000812C9A0|nr:MULTISPECIES: hypothetical protein [unclassified Ensifer]OCP05005.1 hypothetical protein BC362_14695 [Ensifer sp. LC14]OCP11836.1 hypothetical protein BC374_16310 [Ensifer sp. LC13]OCP12393.1 hypothetical protein BBX50_16510 [Ensifer sp. LC11]OCP33640.1 hypothetical protein BC364_15335 [Ensifer sp. LC499]
MTTTKKNPDASGNDAEVHIDLKSVLLSAYYGESGPGSVIELDANEADRLVAIGAATALESE